MGIECEARTSNAVKHWHLLGFQQVRRAPLISLRDKSKGGIFVLNGLICDFKGDRRGFYLFRCEVVACWWCLWLRIVYRRLFLV